VQGRKSCNVGKLRGVSLVLLDAALSLRHIASEKDDDGVKVRAGQLTDPVIRMVGSRVSENFGPSCHSLPKLFRKGGQRLLGNTERPQPVPSKGHRHPAGVNCARRPYDLTGAYLVNNTCEPGSAGGGLSEGEETVPRRQSAGTRQQKVLDIIKLKHQGMS